ncbi:MAG: polynucleotide kinase-phosphatase [Candidatus Sumerlaeia bacterium]|nr:polynucleotide kinase-phosphatase [Candidatus Sumerlaeia bacterium]
MRIKIPELSLVVLIGPSGCGKSTFAARHFGPFETVSSDFCRGLVSNDVNSLEVNDEAFGLLREIVRRRLKRGLLTVVDATNVRSESRGGFVEIAREHHMLPVAIAFDLSADLCIARNQERSGSPLPKHAILNQHRDMRRSLRGSKREGFRHSYVLRDASEVDSAEIVREPLWNNRRHETGPFDIVGDVHGCYEELVELLERLGYALSMDGTIEPPPGRRLVFVGDLVDRGPRTPDVLRLVMRAVSEGKALCVPGNHDTKLMRALRGNQVQVRHGLEASLSQLNAEPAEFREAVVQFLDSLVSHYVFDDGRLVVAHAGMKEGMQGRGSAAVRDFALYGETTGETDEFGLPVRHNWAREYRGKALVVYGHTPVPEPVELNRTINIDTGCVFGGRLSAYRYPEGEVVSVPARCEYAEPIRPLGLPDPRSLSPQQEHDDLLRLDDLIEHGSVETSLRGRVTIRSEHLAPALETISRFGVDPRWLIYLPPTMSPTETAARDGLLEHPAEAFSYFERQGVESVVCEEKHMGSRAVVVLCRDEATARLRFGVVGQGRGMVYTRTGRPFFSATGELEEFLATLGACFEKAGAWDTLESDWVCLDCELMPWSAKARELLRQQYAPVASAGEAMLRRACELLEQGARRADGELDEDLRSCRERLGNVVRFRSAYRRYCWETQGVEGLRLAPFHIMATEGTCHADKPHSWHMAMIEGIVRRADSALLVATPCVEFALQDKEQREQATGWWAELTARGGEGMVVKPVSFVAKGPKGHVQPAIKCRGAEYLRIIYGPDYTRPPHLERLRQRGLQRKRSMALREFALGLEGLDRFVRREPLHRVHECALGVLALESEPVDSRL